MSKRTTKNIAQSLARILAMGGIERQYLTSAIDDESRLIGGAVGDALRSLVDDMDSLNNKSLAADLAKAEGQEGT